MQAYMYYFTSDYIFRCVQISNLTSLVNWTVCHYKVTLCISENVICLKVFFIWRSPSFFDICTVCFFLSFNFNLPASLCLAVFYKQHLVVFSLRLPRYNSHIKSYYSSIYSVQFGTSLVVQRLRLCFQCRDEGLIPDRGAKIPHVAQHYHPPPKKKGL